MLTYVSDSLIVNFAIQSRKKNVSMNTRCMKEKKREIGRERESLQKFFFQTGKIVKENKLKKSICIHLSSTLFRIGNIIASIFFMRFLSVCLCVCVCTKVCVCVCVYCDEIFSI